MSDQKHVSSRKIALVSVMVLAILLSGVTVVFAKVEILNILNSWDFFARRWENGNVSIPFDGTFVPFYQGVNFDTDLFDTATVPGSTCVAPNNTTTRWAGTVDHTHYEVDNNPAGAVGFQSTDNWKLVDCASVPPDGGNPYSPPSWTVLATAPSDYFQVISRDVPQSCSSGNCASEIVTKVYINLDTNCDGTPELEPPVGGVCIYWEAETPDCVAPYTPGTSGVFDCLVDPQNINSGLLPPWGGNFQARVSAGGGDKTINFDINYANIPQAVTLADFSATCVGESPVISWETVSELTNQGFNLYRSLGVNDTNPVQLNATLIPSQGPGSAQGFMYSWTDNTAQPDTEYFYWLEDVDFNGATSMHGPIDAMCSAPTAVALSDLNTNSSGPATSVWAIALALAAGLAGVALWRKTRLAS